MRYENIYLSLVKTGVVFRPYPVQNYRVACLRTCLNHQAEYSVFVIRLVLPSRNLIMLVDSMVWVAMMPLDQPFIIRLVRNPRKLGRLTFKELVAAVNGKSIEDREIADH